MASTWGIEKSISLEWQSYFTCSLSEPSSICEKGMISPASQEGSAGHWKVQGKSQTPLFGQGAPQLYGIIICVTSSLQRLPVVPYAANIL